MIKSKIITLIVILAIFMPQVYARETLSELKGDISRLQEEVIQLNNEDIASVGGAFALEEENNNNFIDRFGPDSGPFLQLVIQSVSIIDDNSRLKIKGVNFAQLDELALVKLGSELLPNVSVTDGVIITLLPEHFINEGGSYMLTVQSAVSNSRSQFDAFEMTIGTVGPQGNPGAVGPQGNRGSDSNIFFKRNNDGTDTCINICLNGSPSGACMRAIHETNANAQNRRGVSFECNVAKVSQQELPSGSTVGTTCVCIKF